MALLETDDCWPGSGWVGGGTENPVGWRYFAGDGAATGPRRPLPAGAIYAEFDFYWEQTAGNDWCRIGLACNDTARADAANGYSVLIRALNGNLEVPSIWNNGTFRVGSDGSASLGGRRSPATAATVGIGNVGGELAVYIAGVLVYRVVGGTGFPKGTWAIATAYDSGASTPARAHFNEVRFYDTVPSYPPVVGSTLGVTTSAIPVRFGAINSNVVVTSTLIGSGPRSVNSQVVVTSAVAGKAVTPNVAPVGIGRLPIGGSSST